MKESAGKQIVNASNCCRVAQCVYRGGDISHSTRARRELASADAQASEGTLRGILPIPSLPDSDPLPADSR